MPSFGMIGAIGGAGQGLVNEGAEIAKDEARTKDTAAKKDYEGWLLAQQDQYKVADDQRNWANEQARAPAKRDMKVADETASAQGKLTFGTQNRDALASNTQAETNAKKTPEEREEIRQRGDYYASSADLNRGAKADSLAARNAPKLDPADEKEVADINKQLEKKQELMDEVRSGKAGVPWDPAKNPAQAQMQTEVSALQMRARAIYERNRRPAAGAGGGAADPLGLRKGTGGASPAAPGMQATGDGTELPAQPGMVGAFTGKPDDAMMAVADIKNPQDRANASAALQAQIRANNGGLPSTVPPGALRQPTPPAPKPGQPAPVAAPTGPLSAQQQLDAIDPDQVAQIDDAASTAAAQRRPVQLPANLQPVAEVVRSLRTKILQDSQAQGRTQMTAERQRQNTANQQVRDRMSGFARAN